MKKKKLSIIIPIYNEKKTVAELLRRVFEFELDNDLEKEILIVEDNSTDGTREIVKKFVEENNDGKIKLVLCKKPRGKGHAVRVGLKKATGDIFVIQDADLEYDVQDYPKLLKPILEGKAEFVLGSRHLNENGKVENMIRKFEGKEKAYAYLMNFGGIFLHSLFNFVYGTKLTDPTTMYKVFTRNLYNQVNFKGNYFELDFEIVAKFIRLGHVPIEVPIKYCSRGLEEGKKVRLSRDIVKWLDTIIRYRFTPISRL